MVLRAASQRPFTLHVLLLVTLLIAQALATASQPADRPVTAATVGLLAGISFKNVVFWLRRPL